MIRNEFVLLHITVVNKFVGASHENVPQVTERGIEATTR
jgi:hypothetical protein